LDRFLVYSVDGSFEGKVLVQNRLLTATCARFPYRIAEEAVRQGWLTLEGAASGGRSSSLWELLTAGNVGCWGRQRPG